MIKICYVIGQLAGGGAERQLYELASGIDREKFEPSVVSLSAGGIWSDKIRLAGIPLLELGRRKSWEFTRLFKLARIIRGIRPDIVHTYLFSANTYGRIAASLSGVPILIASERNLPEIGHDKSVFTMSIDKILSKISDAIICNSDKASKVLVEKYSFKETKVFTIHNGIDARKYSSKLDPSQRTDAPKIVGTVGNLRPEKNHKLFIDVARWVLNHCPGLDVKFLIVGGGPMKAELEEYARGLGVDNRIVFMGERHDIPALLNTMDVFLMTSTREGMPNAIMEAMAAGLPVVATDVGGNGELILDGETGYLCEAEEAIDLGNKLMYLLDNDEAARMMGESGRKRIVKEFSIYSMIRKTEKIYEFMTEA